MFAASAVVLFEVAPVESTHQKRLPFVESLDETAYAVPLVWHVTAVPPFAV